MTKNYMDVTADKKRDWISKAKRRSGKPGILVKRRFDSGPTDGVFFEEKDIDCAWLGEINVIYYPEGSVVAFSTEWCGINGTIAYKLCRKYIGASNVLIMCVEKVVGQKLIFIMGGTPGDMRGELYDASGNNKLLESKVEWEGNCIRLGDYNIFGPDWLMIEYIGPKRVFKVAD